MENGGAGGRNSINGGGPSWSIWEFGNWSNAAPFNCYNAPSSNAPPFSSSFTDNQVVPIPTEDHHHNHNHNQAPHHHLTCLKLGKRQYYEEEEAVLGGVMKRERSSPLVVVPRCQVDGCNLPLVDAKDYHRRHKVCEMHSKAPKVAVLGVEQRFCQQCSRFHVIAEFDDSKRSCRRRLAGHNERRRKSSNESIIRNPSFESSLMGGRFPCMPNSPGRALSLLSSKASPWVSTSDLSSRSSAALRELIAENRAAVLARQLFSDRSWHSVGPGAQAALSYMPHQHQVPSQAPATLTDGWNHFQEAGTHVTLDLMQMPSSSFEILSGRSKSKEEEEECCEIWKSLEGTHVV